jgi:hypothetical protein
MNRSIRSGILVPALAAAALCGAAVANAADVHLSVQLPVGAAAPAYVYDAAPRYDGGDWRHDDRRYDGRRYGDWRHERPAERRACRAPAWNPDARYWPGQRVRRHGEVYVATRLAASVWNVNSPPEWTPNYWVPANCSPGDERHTGHGRRGDWR